LVAGVSGYMKKICAKIGLEPLQLTGQVIELIETKQLGPQLHGRPWPAKAQVPQQQRRVNSPVTILRTALPPERAWTYPANQGRLRLAANCRALTAESGEGA
jgi:hypothetical protein